MCDHSAVQYGAVLLTKQVVCLLSDFSFAQHCKFHNKWCKNNIVTTEFCIIAMVVIIAL
jgi:hypothetical protein